MDVLFKRGVQELLEGELNEHLGIAVCKVYLQSPQGETLHGHRDHLTFQQIRDRFFHFPEIKSFRHFIHLFYNLIVAQITYASFVYMRKF